MIYFLIIGFMSMFLIQGYKEEIFERLEKTNIRSASEIRDWLAGPKRKSSSYSNFAAQLQEPFALREAVEETDEIPELKELKRQSQRMSLVDNKTENIIQDKIDKIQKELTILSTERKIERLTKEKEEIEAERLRKEIQRTETKIQQEEARLEKELLREQDIEPDF